MSEIGPDDPALDTIEDVVFTNFYNTLRDIIIATSKIANAHEMSPAAFHSSISMACVSLAFQVAAVDVGTEGAKALLEQHIRGCVSFATFGPVVGEV